MTVSIMPLAGAGAVFTDVHVESVGDLFGRWTATPGVLPRAGVAGADFVMPRSGSGRRVELVLSITYPTMAATLSTLAQFQTAWDSTRGVVELGLPADVPGWVWFGSCGPVTVDSSLLGVGHVRLRAEFMLVDDRRFLSPTSWPSQTVNVSANGVGNVAATVTMPGRGHPPVVSFPVTGLLDEVGIAPAGSNTALVTLTGLSGLSSGTVTLDGRYRQASWNGLDISDQIDTLFWFDMPAPSLLVSVNIVTTGFVVVPVMFHKWVTAW